MATRAVSLPSLQRKVTQQVINAYAVASSDPNPLHIDPEFGKKTPFGSNIAHGMLLYGYLSELMGQVYGAAWASKGRLKARFRSPAKPNDVVTVTGVRKSVEPLPGGESLVRCSLECRNAQGDVLVSGEAVVTVPGQMSQ